MDVHLVFSGNCGHRKNSGGDDEAAQYLQVTWRPGSMDYVEADAGVTQADHEQVHRRDARLLLHFSKGDVDRFVGNVLLIFCNHDVFSF